MPTRTLALAVTLALAAAGSSDDDEPDTAPLLWKDFDLERVARDMAERGERWRVFLDVDSMFCGVYRLERGATDPQGPHAEDEIYVIRKGRATLTAGAEEIPVEPGSCVFVRRGVEHRFHDIEEDLEVLVIFPRRPALEDD